MQKTQLQTEMGSTTPKIGFIGLGHMGGAMAARLLQAGYAMYGTSRSRGRAHVLIEDGLQWRDTPRDVAKACDVVFTSLPDDRAVEDVASGPAGILAGLTGLLLAERAGMDTKAVLDVMTQSAIGSPMIKARAPLVLDPPQDAWFDIGLMQKDIGLALDTARELHVPLPTAGRADEILSVARALGYEGRDLARSSTCSIG